ncbi:hypothetical protein [Sporosarcina sp. FA9]|uniref:hypothetical protein n=1 Tax=Sporosarcina sp. FA9 TaxID=3413030 RepID=UPI003F65D0CF
MESSAMKHALMEIQRLSDDIEIRKAAIAQEIHMKDQIQRVWEARMEGIEEGRREARQKARQEGIQEFKTEIILNMYHKQYSLEEIADVTNLPVEDVLRLVKSTIKLLEK